MVNTDREIDQVNKNKQDDQVAGKEVSNDMVNFMLKEIYQSLVKQNAMLDDMISDVKGFNNDMKKQNEEWRLETDKLKENTEGELKQVSDNNVVNDSERIINQVSDNDNSNNELINNSDKICLLYTSRCV